MRPAIRVASGSAVSSAEINKVVRNTYSLLAMTLLFSAFTAVVSMAVQPPSFTGIICSLVAMGLIFFVLPRTANSAAGLGVVFGITGLLGFGLGPILSHYLAMPGGSSVIAMAFGSTAAIFLGLSGYVLVTKKDFSFMGGFLMAGMIVAIVAMLVLLVAGLMGYPMPMASLALSAVIAMLMAGFMLYDTSRIVNGGETNYIMATVGIYLSIYNLFTALLHLIGAFSNDD